MDAMTLRIILAIIGIVIFLALYFWEQRRAFMEENAVSRNGRSNWMDEQSEVTMPSHHPVPPRTSSLATDDRADDETAEQRMDHALPDASIIQAFVVSPDQSITGTAILEAAYRYRLIPGERAIFHCYGRDDSAAILLFSVANLIKPGTFPLDCGAGMASFHTYGLALFAQLDGSRYDRERFEAMFATAQALANDWGAVAQDETRCTLTNDYLDQLRQQVFRSPLEEPQALSADESY
jgi:cell division protein ZipA